MLIREKVLIEEIVILAKNNHHTVEDLKGFVVFFRHDLANVDELKGMQSLNCNHFLKKRRNESYY